MPLIEILDDLWRRLIEKMPCENLYPHALEILKACFRHATPSRSIGEALEAVRCEVNALCDPDIQHRTTYLPSRIEKWRARLTYLSERRAELVSKVHELANVLYTKTGKLYLVICALLWLPMINAELQLYPTIVSDYFDVPWDSLVGLGLAVAGLAVIGVRVFLIRQSETVQRVFETLTYIFALLIFIVLAIIGGLMQISTNNENAIPSLDASLFSNPDAVMQGAIFLCVGLITLFVATGLAIAFGKNRDPAGRIADIERDISKIDEELATLTEQVEADEQDHGDADAFKTRHEQLGDSWVHQIYHVITEYNEERQREQDAERERTRQAFHKEKRETMEQHFRQQEEELYGKSIEGTTHTQRQNGRSTPRGGLGSLLIVIASLFSSIAVEAGERVILIQDMSIPKTEVEEAYGAFAQLVLNLPVGSSVMVYGSDARHYGAGTIEGTSKVKIRMSRSRLIGRGKQLFRSMQSEPRQIRDFPTALAEILPQINQPGTILLIKSSPLYRRGDIDFTGRVPNDAFLVNSDSPFSALQPAPIAFRVVILYDTQDFLSPNHRASIQRFWSMWVGRLNGHLVMFTSNQTIMENLLESVPPQPKGAPVFPALSDDAVSTKLKLTSATALGAHR